MHWVGYKSKLSSSHIPCDCHIVKSCKIMALSMLKIAMQVMAPKVDLGRSDGGKQFWSHVCVSTLKNLMCKSHVSCCSSESWLIEPAWGNFGITCAGMANPHLIYNSKPLTRWSSSSSIRGPLWLKHKAEFNIACLVPRQNAESHLIRQPSLNRNHREIRVPYYLSKHHSSILLPTRFELALWWR